MAGAAGGAAAAEGRADADLPPLRATLRTGAARSLLTLVAACLLGAGLIAAFAGEGLADMRRPPGGVRVRPPASVLRVRGGSVPRVAGRSVPYRVDMIEGGAA